MAYIYHRVPHNMAGKVLYPLNQLRDKYPEAYAEHAAKYDQREWLPKRRVPYLDCLWNDVLFFSPVHPEQAKQAIESLGHEFRPSQFFRIPAERLPADKTVVFLYLKKFGKRDTDESNLENWERYDPEKIGSYSELPPETVEYFEERFALNKRPLLWVYVPHILYRGTLDTRELDVVEI